MSSGIDDQADGFDAFFREAKKPLLAMAFVLTGDLATAQDLTQEALLRTWVRWSRVAKYDDPQAWTRRVLFNLAASKSRSDRVRQKARRSSLGQPRPPMSHTSCWPLLCDRSLKIKCVLSCSTTGLVTQSVKWRRR